MSAEGGFPNQTGDDGVNALAGFQNLTLNSTSLGITNGNVVVLPIPGLTTASVSFATATTAFPALITGNVIYQTTTFTLPYACRVIAISIITAKCNNAGNTDLYTSFTTTNLTGVGAVATTTTSGNNHTLQIVNIITATGVNGASATLNVNIASDGSVNTNADAIAGQLAYIIIPT
jgi:hypothetical protein